MSISINGFFEKCYMPSDTSVRCAAFVGLSEVSVHVAWGHAGTRDAHAADQPRAITGQEQARHATSVTIVKANIDKRLAD